MNTSPHSSSSEQIEAAAAAWIVERDLGLSAEQAAEFERWRTADPRHDAALEMLEETRTLLASLPVLRGDPAIAGRLERLRGTEMNRRVVRFPPLLKAFAAIAASLAMALGAAWFHSSQTGSSQAAAYATTTNEYQRIVLPDDSVMEMNGDTRAQVSFSRRDRRIELAAGEAHFTVAKNPARPFVVRAGGVDIRAVGTEFSVRLNPGGVDVLVTEGRVEVARDNPGEAVPSIPPILSAGQRISIPAAIAHRLEAVVSFADAKSQRNALAWRGPTLVFADTPMEEVVREFNRHNRVQLELRDAELRSRGVGGTFRAHAVESFVRLLEDSGDVAVHRPEPNRIVLGKASLARP